MATKYAQTNNALWSAQVWHDAASGGSVTTAPGADDVANLNSKAMTLDVNITCLRVEQVNGYLTIRGNRTINADLVTLQGNSNWWIQFESDDLSLTINGDIYVTATSGSCYCLYYSALRNTVTVNGDISGSTANGSVIRLNPGYVGTLVVNGSVLRTTNQNQICIDSFTSSTVVVNGNVVAANYGGNGAGINSNMTINDPTHSITVNGNVSGWRAVQSGGGRWVITGDVSSDMYGACCDLTYCESARIDGDVKMLQGGGSYMLYHSYGSVTINGDVKNLATSGLGYTVYGYGPLVVNGDVYPPVTNSDNASTIFIASGSAVQTFNGTVYGSDFGLGSSMALGWAIYHSSLTARQTYLPRVKRAQSGVLGMPICNGPWLMIDSVDDTMRWKSPTGWRQFQDEASLASDYPDEADVRSGVEYQFGNSEGTCRVPDAGSVALGVAVDNTTGTAVLTVTNVQSAIAADIASIAADVAEVLAAVNATGTGARSVTITINDGSTALQNARVRVSQGAESYVQSTNASGVVTFNLDDATWTVRVTKPSYTLAAQTLVVNGTETVAYSMTAVDISPPEDPELSTGFGYCYDHDGTPEQDVSIEFELRSGTGDDGYIRDIKKFTATSDANGLVEATFIRGCSYRGRRGVRGEWAEFTVGDVSVFSLPEILGEE